MTVVPAQTLREALTRVHLRVTLFAVGMAGLTVLVAGLATMRGYAQQNLALIARTASYSAAPALVFNDAEAGREALRPLIETPGVARIEVFAADGRRFLFLEHGLPPNAWQIGLIASLAPKPMTVPVLQANKPIGKVVAEGDASAIADYMTIGLLGALACLILTALAAWALAQRLQGNIVDQLQNIARVARAVRVDRNFTSRAPGAAIGEIAQLGDDFNALLDELEAQHRHLQSENATLSHLAAHDPLTGLVNRAAFERRLGFVIEDARLSGDSFAVLYLDGDQFKGVNDRHGHAAGDLALKAMADALRSCLRTGDCAARLGGDEFAVILAPPSDAARAAEAVATIAHALEHPVAIASGTTLTIGMSCGSAIYPVDGTDGQTLLRKADKAMYRAKAARAAKMAETESAQGAYTI